MTTFHYLHRHHTKWHHLHHSALQDAYLAISARTFATGLIGIFLPVYLYDLGYSLSDILWFHTVLYAARAVVDPFVGVMVVRVGPKRVIRWSFLAFLLSTVATATLEFSLPQIAFWLIALGSGVSQSLYFTALNIDMVLASHSKKSGTEVGKMMALNRVFGALGPLMSGYIGATYGFRYVFILVIIILIVASWQLQKTKEPSRPRATLSLQAISLRQVWKGLVAHFFSGMEATIDGLFWPLFLSVIIFANNPFIGVGVVTSMTLFLALLLTTVSGKLSDDDKRGKKIMIGGSIVTSVAQFFRALTSTPVPAIIGNTVVEMGIVGMRTPYYSRHYRNAKQYKELAAEYIILHQVFMNLGRTFCMLGIISLLQVYTDETTLRASLILAGFSAMGSTLQPLLRRRRAQKVKASSK